MQTRQILAVASICLNSITRFSGYQGGGHHTAIMSGAAALMVDIVAERPGFIAIRNDFPVGAYVPHQFCQRGGRVRNFTVVARFPASSISINNSYSNGDSFLVCIESNILDKLVHDLFSSIMALGQGCSILSLIHGVEDG